MQLTPAYGDAAVIRIDPRLPSASAPMLRQRARLAEQLTAFDEHQWAAPSRCEGWSVRDVIVHLTHTNDFWTASITAGAAGHPTRILAAFDPVVTPGQLVLADRGRASGEVLARFRASNERLAAAVASIGARDLDVVAEAPPGHLAVRLVVMHALWDGWIHERDVLRPLGLLPAVEPDEVGPVLAYAAALGPAFLAASGGTRRGSFVLQGTDPDVAYRVLVGPTVGLGPVEADEPTGPGTLVLRGDSVVLTEALSLRRPLPFAVPEEQRWLLGSLDVVFDQAQ